MRPLNPNRSRSLSMKSIYDGLRCNRRRLAIACVAGVAMLVSACSAAENLLDVTDPDIVNPGDVNTPAAANALRLGTLSLFTVATTGATNINNGDTQFLIGGMLADEWRSSDTFLERNQIDRRAMTTDNAQVETPFRRITRVRLGAQQAIEALTQFEAPGWQIGQMYLVLAYAENQLAEDYCSAIPISKQSGGVVEFESVLSTTQAFELALQHVDAAIAAATGTTASAVDVRNAASVLRGRILLNLERYADAATAVAAVPTNYAWINGHSDNTTYVGAWQFNNSSARYSLGNNEGVNGLNFASTDPRVPNCVGGDAVCDAAGATDDPFDPSTPQALRVQLRWADRADDVLLMTGVEARLIEAEAALKAGQAGTALTKLNDLRAATGPNSGGVAGLAPLADAGTTAAREDQLFRERAFWLFGTGHRLGDLRRLVTQYDRTVASVYPTGAWWKGGNYGTDVVFPIPQSEEANPLFSRAACVTTTP
jgi:starch-binding outer membrane protein, SusD/RagB family